MGGDEQYRKLHDSLRICKTCGIEKPLTEFKKCKECKDGFRYKCKECLNNKNRKYPKPTTTEQYCKKCNKFKPFQEFEKYKACTTGFRNRCKECRRELYVKKGYTSNKSWFKAGHSGFRNKTSYKKGTRYSISTEFKKGHKPNNFIDGASKEIYKIVNNKKFRKVRAMVLKRDSFKCIKCFTDSNLHVHHIKSLREAPKLSHDMSNLITLCVKCHSLTHKKPRR